MPEEKSQQSEALTKEDLRFAKERIKSLLAGHKKVWAAQGVSPVISALVSLTDKLALARDNNGETKPGWLYTFLTSSVLSGASAELVNYYVMHEQVAVEMELQKRVHQEFDNFPIAERKRRKPPRGITTLSSAIFVLSILFLFLIFCCIMYCIY